MVPIPLTDRSAAIMLFVLIIFDLLMISFCLPLFEKGGRPEPADRQDDPFICQ